MIEAAIDIGTNSTRLFVGQWDEKGRLTSVSRRLVITKLGQGVDRSGYLHAVAMDRVLAALSQFSDVTKALSADTVYVMATSAVRDAVNQGEFCQRVQQATGWTVEILTGEQEAKLSFDGAVRTLLDRQQLALDQSVVVVDIGGGSTELILGKASSGLEQHASVQVGSVRMTEMFIEVHPICAQERRRMEEEIRLRLSPAIAKMCGMGKRGMVAVGGTATTAAAMTGGMVPYDPERVTGYMLHRGQLEALYLELAAMGLEQRLQDPALQPGREDVIPAGLAILLGAMQLFGQDRVLVCDGDLLQGRLLAAHSS